VNGLSDAEAGEIASEPVSAKRQRGSLEDRLSKLKCRLLDPSRRYKNSLINGVTNSSKWTKELCKMAVDDAGAAHSGRQLILDGSSFGTISESWFLVAWFWVLVVN
jgi:hypothetical protein